MKFARLAAPLAFALFALLGLAGPVVAAEQVPFSGELQGDVARSGAPPIVSVEVTATGRATVIGRCSITIPHTVNVVTRTAQGTYQFIAANGDTLTGTFVGHSTLTETAGVLLIVEEVTITGGTGRFEDAEGSFVCTRLYDSVAGTTTGSFEGTISSPGAANH